MARANKAAVSPTLDPGVSDGDRLSRETLANITTEHRSVCDGDKAPAETSERTDIVEGVASYASCVSDHVDTAQQALTALFQASASLWVLADSNGAGPSALAQWDRARAAFSTASEFLACACHDLGEDALRDHFAPADAQRAQPEAPLSHAAEE